ncbi:hypothetical protein ABVK25_012521, partial [Lepraria finkii]
MSKDIAKEVVDIIRQHDVIDLTARVQREFNFDRTRDDKEQWIRSVTFFDDEHYLIICCTYAQAKAFLKVECMEMDLAFKMVQGKINVFSLEDWNADTK